MTLSLRWRIALTLLPLLVLMTGLGGAAMILLYSLSGRIDEILHANYDSVLYMERLNEAVERIDSSFAFALTGREKKAREQYDESWAEYRKWLNQERENITEPGEDERVRDLEQLTDLYRQQGDAFFKTSPRDPRREQAYFDKPGLEDSFGKIKLVSQDVLRINQRSMESASHTARRTARQSVVGFGVGLAVAALVAGWLAWRTSRAILQPVRLLTQSALAIGTGNLDQVVPVVSGDELGQLGEAFNKMARQLRHYRQTDYARLLRAQRTSQATIDSFPSPVLVVDPEGQVEMANPAAQRLLGVVGRQPDQPAIMAWQPPEALREPLLEAIRQQHSYVPEGFDKVVPFRVDGQEHSFLPRLLPIRDPYGFTLGAAVLLEDVTRFRLLDQVKSDLVATASHELKTPLTSVRLAIHVLLEETVGPLTAKQTELLVDARDNAERLLAVVNNLLDLTRLERGRENLDLASVAPSELLRTAADAVAPRAQDKGVTVVVNAPPALSLVAADPGRFGHALANLLDNALTYTDAGGVITLSATAAATGITLAVADTGIGIPSEFVPHVFDRFFRIPGRSRGSGTGLGLAIVREIVAAHGGTITCESRAGEGTTFRITLPVLKGT